MIAGVIAESARQKGSKRSATSFAQLIKPIPRYVDCQLFHCDHILWIILIYQLQ
jgi:hypothetical protein